MREMAVSSVAELRAALDALGSSALYRGQTQHYGAPGIPRAVSSFDRKGCVPQEMVKWLRYSESILEQWFGEAALSPEFSQALLQHYGWRSFYIDVTSSAAVAAWFAAHEYRDHDTAQLCEDCDERPVILHQKMARYSVCEGTGHLYVIDPHIAVRSTGCVDLSNLRIDNFRPRFQAQSALLLGPLLNVPLAPDCYRSHIIGSRATFRMYAEEFGLDRTTELFPDRGEDPVLASLLDLPWKEIGTLPNHENGIPMFRRTIEIPEFSKRPHKILPPRIALFRYAKVADLESVDGTPENSIVITVPSISLFGSADPAPNLFPKIMALLKQHDCITFEIDDIIQHSPHEGTSLYSKGISVRNRDGGLVEVGELMIEHPGMSLTRAGHVVGWYYEILADGLWKRVRHVNECPCGSDRPHLRHLSALHIVEILLSESNLGHQNTG
jgi:hypothetical protein